MRLEKLSENRIRCIPDMHEYDMLEQALHKQFVVEVYQGNNLIGYADRDSGIFPRFTPIPQAAIDYGEEAPRIHIFIPALTSEYIQIMPGTYSEFRAAILEENEFYLLVSMLNERMVKALEDGTPENHESQVFRGTLLKKLTQFLRKPYVMVSEPPKSAVEAYTKR
jgi:hypothetical protein